MNYLALGDSYSIGEGVGKQENFPTIIAQKAGYNDFKIIAKTGWTTTDLISAIKHSTTHNSYDLITLLIGVNNQYQGKSRTTYKKELNELIKFGLTKVKQKSDFYLFTIPNYGVTPFGKTWEVYISSELNWFNETIKKAGVEFGISVIDITSISLEAKTNNSLLAEDNLHPSYKMYERWVNKFFTQIK